MKILSPYVHQGDSVLDLGPGIGFCTFPLSSLVGENGIVYAADIQKKMLDVINRKATRKQIRNIRTFLIGDEGLNFELTFDFMLLFWMFHEVPEKGALLNNLRKKLKASGKILIAEPFIHVGRKTFTNELAVAEEIGFVIVDYPKIPLSKAAVLAKGH